MKNKKFGPQYLNYTSRSKSLSPRESARNLLIAMTVVPMLIAIPLLLSGGWGPIAVMIAAPFILIGLFVLWSLYMAAPSLKKSASSKKHKKKSIINKLVARLSLLILLCGSILLGWFIISGGPHNGSGGVVEPGSFHILGNSDPYLDMIVGIALLLLGTALTLLNAAAEKLKS